jgi:hypothetical protein
LAHIAANPPQQPNLSWPALCDSTPVIPDVKEALFRIQSHGEYMAAWNNQQIPSRWYTASILNKLGFRNHLQGIQRLRNSHFLVLSGFGAVVGKSVDDFTDELPAYQARWNSMTGSMDGWLQEHKIDLAGTEPFKMINAGSVLSMLGGTLKGTLSVLSNGLMVLLIVIFMLLEWSEFPQKLRMAFVDGDQRLVGSGVDHAGPRVRAMRNCDPHFERPESSPRCGLGLQEVRDLLVNGDPAGPTGGRVGPALNVPRKQFNARQQAAHPPHVAVTVTSDFVTDPVQE